MDAHVMNLDDDEPPTQRRPTAAAVDDAEEEAGPMRSGPRRRRPVAEPEESYVVGELVAEGASAPARPAGMARVTYNPHRSGSFHRAIDAAPVLGAERMRFEPDGSAWFA
jgi:hypothetical protein